MDRIISVNTLIYQGYDLLTILKEISQLEVKAVELAFIKTYSPELKEEDFSERNAQKIRAMLSDRGLTTMALSAYMDLGKDDSIDPFKRRMAFAKEMGADFIISNASQRSNQAIFFRNMESLSEFARSLNLIISLENPGDGEDHIIDSGGTGAIAIQEIGFDYVRLNYDIGNIFINSNGKLRREEDLEGALPWTVHFHLKDVREEEKGFYYSEIGNGLINYPMILKTLSQKAPSVPMGIELPLRLKRGRDFIPWIEPAPAELSEIRKMDLSNL